MKRILLTISTILAFSIGSALGQNVSDLIISEVLAEPDSTGIMDDYGRRNGWIEIFNKSQGTVNFGGCFLSNDRNNLKMSLIPKTDSRTKIGPRQTVLFYASGNGKEGTFYADFKVAKGSTVYLVSNDGRTVIDSLEVPATLPAGKSVIKLAHDLRQMEFVTEAEAAVPTPGSINGSQRGDRKPENGKRGRARVRSYTRVGNCGIYSAHHPVVAVQPSGKGVRR